MVWNTIWIYACQLTENMLRQRARKSVYNGGGHSLAGHRPSWRYCRTRYIWSAILNAEWWIRKHGWRCGTYHGERSSTSCFIRGRTCVDSLSSVVHGSTCMFAEFLFSASLETSNSRLTNTKEFHAGPKFMSSPGAPSTLSQEAYAGKVVYYPNARQPEAEPSLTIAFQGQLVSSRNMTFPQG